MSQDIWIKRVEIKNFQSHRKTELDFVKGTNALIGSSNSGKSAVIRAIRWCLLNLPKGKDFITVGQSEASVKVFLSNGKDIERVRGKGSVNLYRLFKDNELIEEYTGFGSSVPPDIIEAHGIVPIANNVYFQFADQLEAPFMLSLKPSQRADVLGNLEELAQIDKALTSINDDLRFNAKEKKRLAQEEKELTLEHSTAKATTDRLENKVEVLKSLKKGIESKTSLHLFLQKQLERLKEIRVITSEIDEVIMKATSIIHHWPDDIEERLRQFKYLKERTTRLEEIKKELAEISFMKTERLEELESMKQQIEGKIERFRMLSQNIQSLKRNKEMQETAATSFSDTIASLTYNHLDTDISKYKTLFNQLAQLRNVEENIKKADAMVADANVHIDQLLNDFVEALQSAEICATCGQETHGVCKETVESIV